MRIKLKIMTVMTVVCGVMFSSCDNYFDSSTVDALDVSDSYKEKSNVFAGMIGLSASCRNVADHHIILSELLGDLMMPTAAAPDACWDVYRYKATNGNSFASPAPYYNLIVNCNDFLKYTIAYNKAYPAALTSAVYGGMISSAITYRAWAYLQLGKIYGEAIYYDMVFTDNNGVLPSKVMKLDELVDELIYSLKNGVDGVNGFKKLDWTTILAPQEISFGGSSRSNGWKRVSIDADVLLCELYLWAKDYTNAAKTGINYVSGSEANFKLDENFKSDEPLFESELSAKALKEICTYAPFDFERGQTNKLQYYFSAIAPNVCYFIPNSYTSRRFYAQISGIEPEEQGLDGELIRRSDRRNFVTFRYENGTEVIGKYHHDKIKPYEHDAPVIIYRASEIYLMIAEALSGLGGEANITAADSMINVGLKPSWKTDHFEKPFEAPIYGNALSNCKGVRGRVGQAGDYIRYHIDTLVYPGKTELEKVEKLKREKFVIDSLIAEETALELAYEGKRWFTLVRIARNTENPNFLAEQVASKFGTGESQYYQKWLLNPENWFIKWNQTQVLNELKKEE